MERLSKKVRKEKGLEQFELAALVGISKEHLRKIELNEVKSPSFEIMVRLGTLLDCLDKLISLANFSAEEITEIQKIIEGWETLKVIRKK